MKVSVVIPVYNVERYIERCLQSVLHQTLRDMEIIVVNDATPDRSIELVRQIAEGDNRIRIVEHAQNMGLMMARRSGYQIAQGEYVTFVDSDDWLPEDAVERLYEKAVESGADVVSGNMEIVTSTGTHTPYILDLPFGNDFRGVCKALLTKKYGHQLCSKLFKRSLLCEHTYQTFVHATNGEDGILFYQLLSYTNRVEHLPITVYYYFQNSLSSTHRGYSDQGLTSIIRANYMRYACCQADPELEKMAFRYITNVFVQLYTEGYKSRLQSLLAQHAMQQFVRPQSFRRYFSTTERIGLSFKIHASSVIYAAKRIYRKCKG